VLVATDVAARGIHIELLPVVVHYDPPAQATDYLHRSGRTGRAGATGAVISLVGEDVIGQVKRLQKALGIPMSLETREDAQAIRLGAVDDAIASERIDDRGGKGRSERPSNHDRGPRNFEHREPRERSSFVRSERPERNDRNVPERAARPPRGPEDRNRSERPYSPRGASPERPARSDRGFSDRASRPERGSSDRTARPDRSFSDRPARAERSNDRQTPRFNDRGTAPRGGQKDKEAVVSFFNDSKGFGFASDEKGDDLFIHFSSIQGDGFKSLSQGQTITFEESQGPKGREARNVRVVGGGRQRR
jgi:superfamily II DNA/RNA helicase/cold shock CspA family protein